MVQGVESWTGLVKCINDVDRREGVRICIITLVWVIGLVVAFKHLLQPSLVLFFPLPSLASNRSNVEGR
jgi:hypothetical protein